MRAEPRHSSTNESGEHWVEGPSGRDIGGPLVTRATGVDAGYSLVGVISNPTTLQYSETDTFYSVYTEVSHYLSWIAEQYGLTFPSTTNTSGRRKFEKKTRKRKYKGRGRRRNQVKKGRGRGNRRNQVEKGRGRNQVNKRQQSLRWKQRKNKKSEKVGFTQKRLEGRSVGQAEARQDCDPIEVSITHYICREHHSISY